MIARIWTGAVRRGDGDAYAEYMRDTGVEAYLQTPGNRGAWMLRRDIDDRAEFVMFTLWESLDAVKGFAGEDHETAVFYPEDDRYLVERDETAAHFDVVEHRARTSQPRLEGDKVVLRPIGPEDVERLAAIQAEEGVARWWGPPDVSELRETAEGRDAVVAFAIEVDGEVAGLIQYGEENDPDFRSANLDIFLADGYRGRGLGPDALRTLSRHLVEERGHHRLTIDPAADNTAAIRAFERAGFRRVGVMRGYWRAPDGTWRDGLLLDLLASEVEGSHG
jgi:aminoglycoside 6'-N-acetyltransferase